MKELFNKSASLLNNWFASCLVCFTVKFVKSFRFFCWYTTREWILLSQKYSFCEILKPTKVFPNKSKICQLYIYWCLFTFVHDCVYERIVILYCLPSLYRHTNKVSYFHLSLVLLSAYLISISVWVWVCVCFAGLSKLLYLFLFWHILSNEYFPKFVLEF